MDVTVTEDEAGGGYGATGYRTVTLSGSDSTVYGSLGGASTTGVFALNPVTLVLKEKNADITQTGGSFDTSFETAAFGPVVLRGEALYQQGVMTPIVDKAQMSIGNITEAFTAQAGDRFKYVLGLDITVLTNMMISAQIIGDNNLDYVDTTTTFVNGQDTASNTTDEMQEDVVGARYTADMASMSMQNQY